jgi:hypothetical protein
MRGAAASLESSRGGIADEDEDVIGATGLAPPSVAAGEPLFVVDPQARRIQGNAATIPQRRRIEIA